MIPCPFCNFDEGWVTSKDDMYVVECKVCGSQGPPSNTRELATEKWNGLLKRIDDQREFNKLVNEDVSAPIATLTNTPGMGTAEPANISAMTGAQQASPDAIGSGDSWGHVPKKSTKKKKKGTSKTKKKHNIQSLDDFANLLK